MKCPRCETASLDEKDRDGITMDVCRQCRGIWLDRGELELLIARATAEQDRLEARTDEEHDRPRELEHGRHDERHDDEHHGRPWGHEGHGHGDRQGRRRRWYEALTDVFD
jgi:uncharacterized protein